MYDNTDFRFGRYKGLTASEVAESDVPYLESQMRKQWFVTKFAWLVPLVGAAIRREDAKPTKKARTPYQEAKHRKTLKRRRKKKRAPRLVSDRRLVG